MELYLWWAAGLPKLGRVLYFVVTSPLAIWVLRRLFAKMSLTRESLGLTTRGVGLHCLVLGPLTVLLTVACFALVEGSEALWLHFLKRALLYPFWGLLQHALLLGLLYPCIENIVRRRSLAVLITGLLFGALHLPNWPITAATFGLGLVFAALYSYRQTILVIAVCHGILGAGVDEVLDWNMRVGRRYILKKQKRERARLEKERALSEPIKKQD